MPKYKARIVETVVQVAYVYFDAENDDAAWNAADDLLYDIPSSSFKVMDGEMSVDDVELAENEIIKAAEA